MGQRELCSLDVLRLFWPNERNSCSMFESFKEKYNTFLQTHHLIQDYNKKDYQLQKYLDNWVNYLGIDLRFIP